MREKLTTRLLAVVMMMIMLAGALPVQAFAAGTTGEAHTATAAATEGEVTPAATSTDLKLALYDKTARGYAVGRRIVLDYDSIDKVTSGAAIRLLWYAGSTVMRGSDFEETGEEGTFLLDAMVKKLFDGWDYYEPQLDAYGQEVYCTITVYEDAEHTTVKDVYKSDRTDELLLPLEGLGIAGSVLRGVNMRIGAPAGSRWTLNWLYDDGATLRPAETYGGNVLPSLYPTVATDTDIDRNVYQRWTDGTRTYESEKVTIAASDFTETFDLNVAELPVGATLGSRYLSWGIQGFYDSDNLYPLDDSNHWEKAYVFSWIKSSNATVGDGDDEVVDSTSGHSSFDMFSPTLPPFTEDDIGDYYYAKLTSDALRKTEYITRAVQVVAARPPVYTNSMVVGNTSGYTYPYTNDFPSTWTDITYTYRSTSAPGTEGAVVQQGSTGSYYYRDADTGKYIYADIIGKDGTKLATTAYTPMVRARQLALGGTPAVGNALYQSASSYVRENTTIKYEYFRTDTVDPNAAKATVKQGTTRTSSTADNYNLNSTTYLPRYTIQAADIGKYLHLKITIGGYAPYVLSTASAVAERNIEIAAYNSAGNSGDPYVGYSVRVVNQSYLGSLYSEGIRYEWRMKDSRTAPNADTDKVLAEGLMFAGGDYIVTPYRLTAAEVGKYVYLKMYTLSGTVYYSSNSVGRVFGATQLKGALTISGNAVEGEKLTATATFTDISDPMNDPNIQVSWYRTGSTSRLATGWEHTIRTDAVGEQIYAVATSLDETVYYGSVTSARTEVVEGRLTSAQTGVTAIRATLKNDVDGDKRIGFITTGTDIGNREDLVFDISLFGVAAMPKNAVFRLNMNGNGYFAPATADPEAIPGGVTFKNVIFTGIRGDAISGGINTAKINLIDEEMDESTPPQPTGNYFYYQDDNNSRLTHIVQVDALPELKLTRWNPYVYPLGSTQVVVGDGLQILVTADVMEGTIFRYAFESSVTELAVDDHGMVSATVAGADERLIVTAINTTTRQVGTLGVWVHSVDPASKVDVEGLTINKWDGNTVGRDAVKDRLESLMMGYAGDPSVSNTTYALQNTAQLGASVNPSNATANYELEWSSSNTAAATIDPMTGFLTVLKGGEEVTITATIKGSSPAISDSITFTTATPAYEPIAIVYGTKTIKMAEQEYREVADIKVTFKVTENGKTYNRTIKVPNQYFTFSTKNEAVATVSSDGRLFGVAPGKTELTISIGGVSKPVPVEVGEAKYNQLDFTAKGRLARAYADSKGVLRGELLLYEGDVSKANLSIPLENAVAYIWSGESGQLVSRDANLSGLTLKLSKKYKLNVPTDYTIKLKNGQKLVLTVTVASTQPEFIDAGPLYNKLEARAAVQFKVFKGTRVKHLSVESAGNVVKLDSWSQTSEFVTAWVWVPEGTKAKKTAATFKFETADLFYPDNASKDIDKTLKVNLKVASPPKASMAATYMTGPAFQKDGYYLYNMHTDPLDSSTGATEKAREERPEFTQVLGQYINGVTTVFTGISNKKSNLNFFDIRDNVLVLKDGVDPATLPTGRYTYSLEYYYASMTNAAMKTDVAKANIVINISGFTFNVKTLNIQMQAGYKDTSDNYVTQSLSFDLMSNLGYNINKTDAKKGYWDQRYQFGADTLYELVWKTGDKAGQPVDGVTVRLGIYGDAYRGLYLDVSSNSELLKGSTSIYKSGTFNLLLHERDNTNTLSNPVTISFTPEIRVNNGTGAGAAPTVKVGKINAFNQFLFGEQYAYTTLTYSPGNFLDSGNGTLDWVMTSAPQMDNPFYLQAVAGYLHVYSQNSDAPAVGTYKYDCTITNRYGITSKMFKVSITVTKAVNGVVISAKSGGTVNPYYADWESLRGIAKITFTSNIPNLPIGIGSYPEIMQVPKGGNSPDTSTVASFNLGDYGDIGKCELYVGPNSGVRYYSNRSYVPYDVEVICGMSGNYTARFGQLSAIKIKDSLNDKTYRLEHKNANSNYYNEWNLAYKKDSTGAALFELYANNNFGVTTPKYDPFNDPAVYQQDPMPQLYKLINGNYIPVDDSDVEWFDTITLTGTSAKNFEVVSWESASRITMRPISNAGRKAGTQKLTFSVIPDSSSSTVKKQVVDHDGNELYTLAENFTGKETYTKYTVNIPKPVTMTASIRAYYDYTLPPDAQK